MYVFLDLIYMLRNSYLRTLLKDSIKLGLSIANLKLDYRQQPNVINCIDTVLKIPLCAVIKQ